MFLFYPLSDTQVTAHLPQLMSWSRSSASQGRSSFPRTAAHAESGQSRKGHSGGEGLREPRHRQTLANPRQLLPNRRNCCPSPLREQALTPVYGLAEAGLAVTFSDPRRRFRVLRGEGSRGRDLVSAGRPLEGFEVRIDAGRVLVRGPSVVPGYLGQPEVLEDGWLDTGAEGFLRDGELYLTGRDRDKIVLRGANYSPEFFEDVLEQMPGLRPGSVAACGVVTDFGEELCILAEIGPGAVDEKSIQALVAERTRVVPKHVLLLEPGTLPRTSSGKIRRAEAAKRFLM